MTDKTETTALVIAEELNEWARDYGPIDLAKALAHCGAALLKNQQARIAELEALQAAPPAPAAVAVPASKDQYLCQAWGETDLPAVAIVDGLDGVRAFLIEQWLGDEDAAHDDGTKPLLAAMQEMQDEWAEEGEAWKWEIAFEIGGVSVQKVGRAALAAAPAQEHATQLAGQGQECGVCGSDEAFTGTCGGGRTNSRALCFQGAAPAQAQEDARDALTQAARDVLAERQRQISNEGRSADADDLYQARELAAAAATYVLMAGGLQIEHAWARWPWPAGLKEGTPRRMLEKAGALILAEMERLDRAAARAAQGGASEQ